MNTIRRRRSLAAPTLAACLGATALLIGVALGENHVPVPIAPDAPYADGAQVATFALG